MIAVLKIIDISLDDIHRRYSRCTSKCVHLVDTEQVGISMTPYVQKA